jgi:hypothetical protein
MRKLADLFGAALVALGILLIAAGYFLYHAHPAGFASFWLGMPLVIIGAITSSAASKKTCPQCAERVRAKALKCRHCRHQFAQSAGSLSTPFYK